MNLLITAYFAAIAAQMTLRSRIDGARRRQTKVDRRITKREQASLLALTIAVLLVPIVYAATRWLDFADYHLPAAAGGAGLLLLAGSLLVFWRSHADIGLNWSPSLEIRERHELVTRGIYGVVRHPMYTSLLLWAIAQPLLLQNWVAGPLGLIAFPLFYFLRVGPEERMMIDTFGDRYRAYMARVGGLVPRPASRRSQG